MNRTIANNSGVLTAALVGALITLSLPIHSASGTKPPVSPTPGSANSDETYDGGQAPPPSAGIPNSGHYSDTLSFVIPRGVSGAVVACDLTGALPTKDSPLRSGVKVDINKTVIMRCMQFKDGAYPSVPVMRTYIVGERLPSLPIFSIAVSPHDMFDSTDGIYSMGPSASPTDPHFGANFWRNTELPIQMDFFDDSAKHAWNHFAGLRIFGGWTRANPKKSVVITFRKQYGANRLNYPLFPEYPQLTRFKHFVLRSGGNNAGIDYIRDMLMTSLTEGLDIDYQKGRPVIVYYNGEYFGIHNLRERSNGDYFKTNYGINEDHIDLVKGDGSVSEGSSADYQSIIRWLESLDGLSDENLAALDLRIDLDNYTNYIQSEIFYINKDWPVNNLKKWRANTPPSRWKWFLYDTDHGFGGFSKNHSPSVPMLAFATATSTTPKDGGRPEPNFPNPPHTTFLTRKLFENQSYRNAFVNRFSLLLATYFSTERVNARIDALMAPIESEIPLDIQRWRHSIPNVDWRWNPRTIARELDSIKKFGAERPAQMQREIEQFFKLGGAVDFSVSVSGNERGRIRVHNLEVLGNNATFKAYPKVPVVLTAVSENGAEFEGWSDGVKDAERIVVVTAGRDVMLRAVFR